MTNAQVNPTFSAYYRQCVTKLELEMIRSNIQQLHIYLQPEYKEDWMTWPSFTSDYLRCLKEWVSDMGLLTHIRSAADVSFHPLR